jgi:hypothetical protein
MWRPSGEKVGEVLKALLQCALARVPTTTRLDAFKREIGFTQAAILADRALGIVANFGAQSSALGLRCGVQQRCGFRSEHRARQRQIRG